MRYLIILIALCAVSCGGDSTTATYTVGGTLTSPTDVGLIIQNNLTDACPVTSGTFVCATALHTGDTYSVSIENSPLGYQCTIFNGVGEIEASNITNIEIICTLDNPG